MLSRFNLKTRDILTISSIYKKKKRKIFTTYQTYKPEFFSKYNFQIKFKCS